MIDSPSIDVAINLFRASGDEQAEGALATLLEQHAVPLVRRIVRRRLGAACSEADDVCAHVALQLVVRLRRERGAAGHAIIEAFASYVATAAHHGCDHFLRGKCPLLWELRHWIRFDGGGDMMESLAVSEPRVDALLVQRAHLAEVWTEIGALPLRQRHALLLNLRDDAAALFVSAGVASLQDIATVLELPGASLAALWSELPLADNAIAERLGCTRQQVINLRLAARKRLANRLGRGSQYPSSRRL